MILTPAQCRAARALIGWSQDQLATASRVAKATIANFEAALRYPQPRTLEEIQAALEGAGVEFTNGGQPGVRFHASQSAALRIVSSSDLSVRLHPANDSLPLNVVVVVQREALDDYFELRNTSKQFRRDIVEANLNSIAALAHSRYQRRVYSTQVNAGTIQIVLSLADLKQAELRLPGNPA